MVAQEGHTVMEYGNTEAHKDIEYGQINKELRTFPNFKELCIYIYIHDVDILIDFVFLCKILA